MSMAKERFQAAKAQMKAAQAEARELAKDVFKEGAAVLFEAHPKLESFGWTQYTPYFNDGDECVFSANIDDPNINGCPEYELEALRETQRVETGEFTMVTTWAGPEKRPRYAEVPNPAYDPELAAAAEAVGEFLKGFEEDDYKELFGDHMEVTVKRDGTLEVEEHEHD